MKRRKFLVAGGFAGLGCAALGYIGLKKAKPRLKRYLSTYEFDPAPGDLTDAEVENLAAFCRALTDDFDPAVTRALRPWLDHHAARVPGFYDRYRTGAYFLNLIAKRQGYPSFAVVPDEVATEQTARVMRQQDNGSELLDPAARERWCLRANLAENLIDGWAASDRAWAIVGYENLAPGSFPGRLAYTEALAS